MSAWAEQLAAWAIPKEILDQAPESPWGFPPALFGPPPSPVDTPSRRRALEALPEGGRVLDVGCGAGAASLALVPRAGFITGVDSLPPMLAAFDKAAAAADVSHRAIEATWPTPVEEHDVVVCHHVLYNVPDIDEFVRALTSSAHIRIVCELTEVHPQVALNDLWRHFWSLERPSGPTADDAADAIRSTGVDVGLERWTRAHRNAAQAGHADRSDVVAFYRRRLCLPADRDAEIDAMLPAGTLTPPAEVVTLWWDAPSGP